MDRKIAIIAVVLTAAVLAITAFAIVEPALFHKNPPLSRFLATLTVIFTVVESVVTALASTLLLTTAWGTMQIFLFGVLAMHVSDIAIRYQSVDTQLIGMTIFEAGWCFGITLIATAALEVARKRDSARTWISAQWLPFASLRSMTIGIVFASLVALWLGLTLTSGRGFSAINVSAGFLVICGAFSLAVVSANIVTRQLTELVDTVCNRQFNMSSGVSRSAPYEIQLLLSRFDKLRREIESEKNNTLKLTAQVVHDLRAPLVVFKIVPESLRKELMVGKSETESIRERWEAITLASRSIEQTCNSLLRTRKDIQDTSRVDEAVENAVAMARRSYPNYNIEYETAADPKHSPVIDGLTRVLSNLIKNSVEASRPDQLIAVRLIERGGEYVLTIKDHGAGIPSTVLKKIELGEIVTTKAEGNGLGLSAMLEWSKSRGIRYSISSSEGQGTAITLAIPAGAAS